MKNIFQKLAGDVKADESWMSKHSMAKKHGH